jgi:hypothetical protein
MKVLLAMALAAAALPALAQTQLTEREREMLARQQQQRDQMYAAARARCIEQRGVDCDTEQGLQEWLLLNRSREQAVLDNLRPGVPAPQSSSGSGSTTPAPGR